jgi:Lrp/AsnC family transcriptional regulator
MDKTPDFDETDRRILRALQANADLGQAALAEQVRLSPASCWRRIQSLEARGVLQKSVRLLDPARVGCGVNVLCHVRMNSHSPESRGAFESFVASRPEIMECYSMSGEWDYLLRVVVGDVAGYERFLMRDLLAHPWVATASSHFALSQVKYTTALPI